MAHNYATCGGPTRCRHCGAILTETPAQRHTRLLAEDRERRDTPSLPRDEHGIPDPYAAATVRAVPVVKDANGIPDPYLTAIARRKEAH